MVRLILLATHLTGDIALRGVSELFPSARDAGTLRRRMASDVELELSLWHSGHAELRMSARVIGMGRGREFGGWDAR